MPHKVKGKRPDGLIQVTLKIGYKEDGSPKRLSFYGKTRSEAEAKRELYIRTHTGKNNNITVDEWIRQYKETYRNNVDPEYLKKDNTPYNRLSLSIGFMRLIDVKEAHLQSCLNKVSGMSSSTVTKYYTTIRKLFSKARKNKLIPDDPSEDLIKPQSVKGTHRALDRWEVDLIINNWNAPGVRFGTAVMIMLFAGLRRGELIALRWDDIDLANRTLHIRHTAMIPANQPINVDRAKSTAGIRDIPICNILYNCLSLQTEKTGFVCVSSCGSQLSGTSFKNGLSSFNRSMERIYNNEPLDQRGFRSDLNAKNPDRIIINIRAHDLRHTFATFLHSAGVPVKAAQYYLGHSDIKMTLGIYTHLSEQQEAESRLLLINKLDGWMSSQGTVNLSDK